MKVKLVLCVYYIRPGGIIQIFKCLNSVAPQLLPLYYAGSV